jgi:hypothetical protein
MERKKRNKSNLVIIHLPKITKIKKYCGRGNRERGKTGAKPNLIVNRNKIEMGEVNRRTRERRAG